MGITAVEVQDLKKHYGATPARNIDFLLPGILAMSLMQLGLFGTAPALVQLREQQVPRRIGATPLPRATLLASQVLHRITIGTVQTFVIIIVGTLVFQVNIIGNAAVLAGFVLLGALMFCGPGIPDVWSRAHSRKRHRPGPTRQLPDDVPVRPVLPGRLHAGLDQARGRGHAADPTATVVADALRQIMVGATPVYSLGVDFAVLAAWLVVCAALAV